MQPLLPSTETVTRPRLAAREDLDAAAKHEKSWRQQLPQELTFGNALLPEPIDGFGSVAIARFQRLFAIQHGCSSAIAQNFHVCGRHGGKAAHKSGSHRGAAEGHHDSQQKSSLVGSEMQSLWTFALYLRAALAAAYMRMTGGRSEVEQ